MNLLANSNAAQCSNFGKKKKKICQNRSIHLTLHSHTQNELRIAHHISNQPHFEHIAQRAPAKVTPFPQSRSSWKRCSHTTTRSLLTVTQAQKSWRPIQTHHNKDGGTQSFSISCSCRVKSDTSPQHPFHAVLHVCHLFHSVEKQMLHRVFSTFQLNNSHLSGPPDQSSNLERRWVLSWAERSKKKTSSLRYVRVNGRAVQGKGLRSPSCVIGCIKPPALRASKQTMTTPICAWLH